MSSVYIFGKQEKKLTETQKQISDDNDSDSYGFQEYETTNNKFTVQLTNLASLLTLKIFVTLFSDQERTLRSISLSYVSGKPAGGGEQGH